MNHKAKAYQASRKMVCKTCGKDVTAAVRAIGENAVANLHRLAHGETVAQVLAQKE